MKPYKSIAALFLLYLILVFPCVGRPLVTDEITLAQAAKIPWSFANQGPGGHPPLYIDMLKAASQFLGLNDGGLRIVGILCFLLSLIIIYYLAGELFRDKRTSLLACLIFATHPMAIQGSMILDIDNTILTVLLTAAVLYLVKNIQTLDLKKGVFLTLLFSLCLWAKLSTPLILMGSAVLFYTFKKNKIKVRQVLVISLGAFLVFLLMWKIDSMIFHFPFSLALRRISGVFSRGTAGVSLPAGQELVLRLLRVSLWIGVYMMVFVTVIIFRRIKEVASGKKRLDPRDLLIIYCAVIFVGYTLVGGLSFGFAKYQYPLLPILSIFIASAVMEPQIRIEKKHLKIYAIACGVLFLANILNLPDPIYQINYQLRKVSIFFPEAARPFAVFFSWKLALSLFFLFLAVEVVRRLTKEKGFWRPFCFLSFAFIILNNCFTDIYLWKVPFFTTYCYGRDIAEFKEISALCRRISGSDNEAKIIAPEDILYHARLPVWIGYEQLWNNREKFLEAIKGERVKAVVYAFTYNPIFSYRHIFFEPSVSDALKNNFTQSHIGEYTVWIKR